MSKAFGGTGFPGYVAPPENRDGLKAGTYISKDSSLYIIYTVLVKIPLAFFFRVNKALA
jgi:hypothetical protein